MGLFVERDADVAVLTGYANSFLMMSDFQAGIWTSIWVYGRICYINYMQAVQFVSSCKLGGSCV